MPSSIDKYLEEMLIIVGEASFEAIKETVTEEAKQVYEDIKQNTPVRTGGLKNSLKIKEIKDEKNDRYGFNIYHDGYNSENTAYAYIGSTLNKGTSKIPATRYIDNAVQKLKGMDDRIHQKFIEKVNKGEGG